MKALTPSRPTTEVTYNGDVWIPKSFDDCLSELHHISSSQKDHLFLFRGHQDATWVLDSLFARSLKTAVFGFKPGEVPSPPAFSSHWFALALHATFHFKFGVYTRPSPELFNAEKEDPRLDPWFEWLKRLQQHPEEDSPLMKGSNLLDWTASADVAIWFANENRKGDGAVYVFDASALGCNMASLKMADIFERMEQHDWTSPPPALPQLFCPTVQVAHERSRNQQVSYIAQMDLRVPLEDVWRKMKSAETQHYIKIILPAATVMECEKYLDSNGVTRTLLFPDGTTDP